MSSSITKTKLIISGKLSLFKEELVGIDFA